AAQAELTGCAGAPFGAPASRMIDAIEGGEQCERSAVERTDLHVLAEPSARCAGTSGTRTQLTRPEHQGRSGFDDLNRCAADRAGKRGRRQPVELGARTGATVC